MMSCKADMPREKSFYKSDLVLSAAASRREPGSRLRSIFADRRSLTLKDHLFLKHCATRE